MSSSVLPPEIMLLWLEMSQRNIHCFPHFFLYHNAPRIAVFYPNTAEAYLATLDKAVSMFAAELSANEKTAIKYLITEGAIGLRGIPKMKASAVSDLKDVDVVVIPERGIYDKAKSMFTQINPALKVFWLGDIITDIYQVAIVAAPLVSTLVSLKNNGHSVLFVLAPLVEDLEKPSFYERWLYENRILNGGIGRVIQNAFPISGLEERFSFEEYCRFAVAPFHIIPHKNYYVAANCSTDGYNIVNNMRATSGQPKEYDFRVHVFGNSAGFGALLPDNETSSSHLQNNINKNGIKACVSNYCMDAATSNIINLRIQDTIIEERDMVVVIQPKCGTFSVHPDFFEGYYIDTLRSNGIPTLNGREFFQRPHDLGEVFLDARHLNHNGNKRLGELIYEALFESPMEKQAGRPVACPYLGLSEEAAIELSTVDNWYDPFAESAELIQYIETLKSIRKNTPQAAGRIGAIVVNCNPFTLGHRYLIEKAAAVVDFLYVFVVEEDRSIFPFEDRIDLVDKGTEDLPNVGVMESGRFIISTLTFPEYFIKGECQGAQIDPSADVELFGQYIAPSLGISIRFAGTEPNDTVTKQYNEAMAKLLPRYGIEFREIERITFGGQPISASRVRKLLEKKDFDEIEKIVPPATLEYLRGL